KVFEEIVKIFPEKKLTIIFYKNKNKQPSQKKISELTNRCKGWTVKEDTKCTYDDCHDRYLLIDNQIEIILTSGFDYLFDKDKDFTYIVRNKLQINSKR
ncbi:MAG: hypothetical protein QM487_11155, partial [Candidatus Marithrix sp.]